MGDPAEKLNETLWGVDLETGEILDPEAEIKAKDLPQVAGWIQGVEREQARLREFRQNEVNRIAESTQQVLDRLEVRKRYFLLKAEDLMRSTGDKKLLYPGYGTFKFGSTRESVNDDEYKGMIQSEKDWLHAEREDLFRSKTTISPDKKSIMVALKGKDGPSLPGFSLNEKRETFQFKAEVDDVG